MSISASDVHVSKMPVKISERALSRSKSYNTYRFTRNSVLSIIVFVTLIVVGFFIFNIIATPEFLVKRKIEGIAKDYYENYFYDSVPDHEALDLYKDTGLARVNLRQLLLYSDKKHATSLEYFEKYCNLENTYIKIYPENPYGRENYHINYTYSCNF